MLFSFFAWSEQGDIERYLQIFLISFFRTIASIFYHWKICYFICFLLWLFLFLLIRKRQKDSSDFSLAFLQNNLNYVRLY